MRVCVYACVCVSFSCSLLILLSSVMPLSLYVCVCVSFFCTPLFLLSLVISLSLSFPFFHSLTHSLAQPPTYPPTLSLTLSLSLVPMLSFSIFSFSFSLSPLLFANLILALVRLKVTFYAPLTCTSICLNGDFFTLRNPQSMGIFTRAENGDFWIETRPRWDIFETVRIFAFRTKSKALELLLTVLTAQAIGVTKFTTGKDRIWVTLCCTN